jgi:hypothetical protein
MLEMSGRVINSRYIPQSESVPNSPRLRASNLLEKTREFSASKSPAQSSLPEKSQQWTASRVIQQSHSIQKSADLEPSIRIHKTQAWTKSNAHDSSLPLTESNRLPNSVHIQASQPVIHSASLDPSNSLDKTRGWTESNRPTESLAPKDTQPIQNSGAIEKTLLGETPDLANSLDLCVSLQFGRSDRPAKTPGLSASLQLAHSAGIEGSLAFSGSEGAKASPRNDANENPITTVVWSVLGAVLSLFVLAAIVLLLVCRHRGGKRSSMGSGIEHEMSNLETDRETEFELDRDDFDAIMCSNPLSSSGGAHSDGAFVDMGDANEESFFG